MSEQEKEAAVRLIEANRAQMRLVPLDLEGMLADDHQARAVWAFVERFDLSDFHARIKAREGAAGRPAIDPRILLALWLLATLDAVGSAREIERLCEHHLAYQWICGGVRVNHHTLSDFRNLSSDLLNGLLTQSVTALMSEGLVELLSVAQDGMKVRASAGASSFRTKGRLKSLRKTAREQVERLSKEIEADPGASSRRRDAARNRAAESRAKRIERALNEMKEVESRKRSNNGKKKSQPRTSVTDPESRVMKMPDGGFRPAYNVHLVTTVGTRMVVGVKVNNEGTDVQTMVGLADQVRERFEQTPDHWLADGGCASLANVEAMDQRGCEVFAPLRARQAEGRKPTDIIATDTPAVRRFRKRMGSRRGKEVYRRRGETAEWVNAQFRNDGLIRFLVRGAEKVLAAVLMHALTNNMRRTWSLA